jgi:hypothetical protein
MNIISLIQLCVSLVLLAIGFFIFRLSMADRRELLGKTSAADKTAAYNQELLRWLELKTMGKSIAGCLEEKKIKKLSIYGAGDIGKFLKNEVETHGFTVHYMIDSNPDKLDDLSFHCPVVLP